MLTPWVMRIIVANIAMYLIALASPAAIDRLVLVPALVLARPWSPVTYMFLHASTGHIFFNMLALFFFGPRLEAELGGRSFLTLYFVSGVMGAVLSFFFTPFTAIVGASGAIYGVMLAFAYYWPKARIFIWGILPIESRYLVIIMTAFSLFGGFGGGGGDGTAHFAHLGGFLGGFIYLRWFVRNPRVTGSPQQVVIAPPSKGDLERWSKINRGRMHEVNREELDRILQKMNTTGVATLTQNERAFLDRFSE